MHNNEIGRFSLLEIDDVPATPAETPAAEAPTPTEPAVDAKAAFEARIEAARREREGLVIPTPASMKTSAGVNMSPRMSRCYAWLQARVAPGFDPFWTDGMVQTYANKIDDAIAAAEALPADVENRDDLVADLRAVRARTPDRREASTATETAAPASKVEKIQDQLVTFETASDFTGAMVFWQLTGNTDANALGAALTAEGLPAAFHPKTCSMKVALSRATGEERSGCVLVRKHPLGGWALVFERGETDRLNYEEGIRFDLENDQIVAHGSDAQTEERVRAAFNAILSSLATTDISAWLTDTIEGTLDGVALRERGGMYFVPSHKVETLQKIKRAIAASSECIIYAIPAVKSADTIAAALAAMVRDAQAAITKLENELNDPEGVGTRAAANRIEQIDALATKVRGYEKLLGRSFADTLKSIAEIRAKFEKVSTRGAMLEVD